MTERHWRLIFGSLALIFLAVDFHIGLLCLVGLIIFEGLSNIRVPMMFQYVFSAPPSILVMAQDSHAVAPQGRKIIHFDAQRALRLGIACFMGIPLIFFPQLLWFLPWFVGIMLTMSGITGVCPMLMFFQWLGFESKSEKIDFEPKSEKVHD